MVRSRALTLMLLMITGCAAIHRPPTTIAALLQDADSARIAEASLRDTMVARLARRVLRRSDHTVDVLMLSGGGQNGAYGVGFMRGWRARTDAPLPTFDLIAAISTGAMQAPFLLMGGTAALDTLTDLYRNAADRVTPTLDWWFWLRKTGGVANMSRYNATLARVVSNTFRDSLQRAFADDRQVVFGTTDMDLGTGRLWDLRASIANPDSGLARTQSLLRAASSIPGVFPPLIVDGHVHSDGGIVSNILTPLTLDQYRAMLRRVRDGGYAGPVTVRMWVVLNGWTHAAPVAMNPASRKAITSRWGSVSFYTNQPQVLQGLEYLAQAATSSLPGLTMQMRFTAIPSELGLEPGANTFFDKAWMQRLEALGEERARSSTPWDAVISPYVRPTPRTP
jgi:Patatin-like phospholipase